MDGLFASVIVLCALGCGLGGGVFFAFSTFVMPALGRIAPHEGISAMQSINVMAVRPWLMSLLFGTAALCLVVLVLVVLRWEQEPAAASLAAASIIYLAGCIGVTRYGNVPLNIALGAVAPADPAAAQRWSSYLRTWTQWNHVRTVACTVAAVLFILALR